MKKIFLLLTFTPGFALSLSKTINAVLIDPGGNGSDLTNQMVTRTKIGSDGNKTFCPPLMEQYEKSITMEK